MQAQEAPVAHTRALCVGAVVALLLLGQVADGSPGAEAAVPAPEMTCSFDPATGTALFTSGTGEDTLSLERQGDEIKLYSVSLVGRRSKKGKTIWKRELYAPVCAPFTPTIANANQVQVILQGEEQVDLDVSLAAGRFAPGATAEPDGSSEIELTIVDRWGGNSVTFVDGPESSWFRFGVAAGGAGVNLNAEAETAPDVDATVVDASDDALRPGRSVYGLASARMGSGNDQVTATGGPEFISPLPATTVASGGPGNDILVSNSRNFTLIRGGTGDDLIAGGPRGGLNLLFGGSGADTVTGGSRRDEVDLGKGPDTATLKGGGDIVVARDRSRDRVNCGGGRDFASHDGRDRLPGCEVKTKRRFKITLPD